MDQSIIIGIIVAVIIGVISSSHHRSKKSKAQASAAVFNGKYSQGHIIAVKKKCLGERKDSEVRVHVEFHNPETGELSVYPHHFSRDTPNMPECLIRCGDETVDANGSVEQHAETKFYRAELESQGRSASEIRQAVMDRAMAQANGGGVASIQSDGNGYRPLRNPIPVDVYLHPEAPSGNGIHIVFPK